MWVHLRKERFPSKTKINDNAYKIDLPGDSGVSCTFNVSDLKPYFEDDKFENLRAKSFLEEEDDVTMGDQQEEPKECLNNEDIKSTSQLLQGCQPAYFLV